LVRRSTRVSPGAAFSVAAVAKCFTEAFCGLGTVRGFELGPMGEARGRPEPPGKATAAPSWGRFAHSRPVCVLEASADSWRGDLAPSSASVEPSPAVASCLAPDADAPDATTDIEAGAARAYESSAPAADASSSNDGDDEVDGIIGVGYGGIRIVSRDLGLTWEDEVHWTERGGDDFELLRTIAYGNGQWISGGWQVTTSGDGVHWTKPLSAEDVISAINCQVTDGLAFGNGMFLVACGGSLARSVDGTNWERAGDTPDVGGHPYLVFEPTSSLFACSGDNGASFVSGDGSSWEPVAYAAVHLCAVGLSARNECPSFYFEGVYLSAEWGGHVLRSSDGREWQTVYTDGFVNNLFTEYAFATGRVAP
jgi:hypothetical protein